MSLDRFLDGTLIQWMAPLVPSQRVFYLYLLSALLIAALTYFWFALREGRARPEGIKKGLLGYIFDRDVWFHRSARQDYLFFFVNAIIYYGLVSQLLISGHVLYGAFGDGLEWLFGVREVPLFEATTLSVVIYTVVVLLAIDFAVFITHYFQHKVVVLWQFHQVHHSAEVLTPATVYRMHPVDLFFTGLVSVGLLALAFAGFVYLTGQTPRELTVLNVNVVLFTFYLIGYNLRHSHIWLSYPPWVSYIFISPAQHQTHHSIDAKHYDRNFGLVFAFWDWMFGTLYVPKGYEKLEFGISRKEPNPFANVTEIYIKPFREAWKLIAPSGASALRRFGVVAAIGLSVFGYVTLQQTSRLNATTSVNLPSLHLQDLTWTEVRAALDNGYDTVIIPTGGTEQNGPHVILGKHNYVVREAADRVASALGGALIAPVMAYVPEGASGDAPDGHMRWAGTLSLPEPLFEAVLEETARSIATHGFTRILLIGDSGWNQDAQARVAAKLSAEWADRGITVLHVGDYYGGNGQMDWLKSEGYAEADVGFHAGIRDTSEVLAVNPQGVRRQPVPAPEGSDPGYNGSPAMASAQIGETMLRLKVEAALRQIRAAFPSNS